MPTQAEKGLAFRALHERAGAFLIPNPWDVGTSRLLAHLGFEALATTSAGCAFALGQPDNTLTREQAMAHASAMASATNLPVSGDLENGFGDNPEYVAETIRLAVAAGLVGGSIEDMTRQADHAIYEKEYAAERIRAAAESARALPFPFTLTARAENYLVGRADLNDTIERLQAYQVAGANVLYAPGLPNKDAIAAVVSSVDRPVNVLIGLPGLSLTLEELSALGVKRVSLGSALARIALGAFLRAAREMRDSGGFGVAQDAVSYREINAIFAGR
jgi:2-methylisocitrate lyase-like PEP mutase family enzyme